MTLTSLLSCLVTCSSGNSSTSTTTVILDTSECSVGPTAREWMLNPRRANSPETRVSTPGRFSTSTDSVCLLMGRPSFEMIAAGFGVGGSRSVLAIPGRADAARELDVVVADPRRNHRPDHRVPVHDEVDDHRNVVDGHRLFDRFVDVLRALAAQPHAAVGVGELDEVRNPLAARRGVQVSVGVALVVEQRLPLAD